MANGTPLLDGSPILERVVRDIMDTGDFPVVLVGEPKSMAVNARTTVAVYFKGIGIEDLSLAGAVHTIEFWVRLYIPMLRLPQSQIEIDLMNGYLSIFFALAGDVTLGGQVRNLNFAGTGGAEMAERAGYVDVSGTMCRVADIGVSARLDQEGVFGYRSN